MPTLESSGRNSGGVIRFVGFDPRCPRELAESLTVHVASLYGIGSVVLASEADEDWTLLNRRIYGTGATEPENAPQESVLIVVPTDATVVIMAKYAGRQNDYERFAAGLVKVDEVVRDLTARLN